jgi:hypothetical protein
MRGQVRQPSLGSLLKAIAGDVTASRRGRRLPEVTITLDIESGHEPMVDAEALRAGLAPLVSAACEAAGGPAPASDSPSLHEVIITVVATPRVLEIEVASSGPGPECLSACDLAAAGDLAADVGGRLVVTPCPEGGTAVTLCLPFRHAYGQSVRPAA